MSNSHGPSCTSKLFQLIYLKSCVLSLAWPYLNNLMCTSTDFKTELLRLKVEYNPCAALWLLSNWSEWASLHVNLSVWKNCPLSMILSVKHKVWDTQETLKHLLCQCLLWSQRSQVTPYFFNLILRLEWRDWVQCKEVIIIYRWSEHQFSVWLFLQFLSCQCSKHVVVL